MVMEISTTTSNSLEAPTPNPNSKEGDRKPSSSTTTRRPRVREVSSRFMSPVVSSSSSGDLHIPTASNSKCPLPNPISKNAAPSDLHRLHHQRSLSVQRRHPSPSSNSSDAHNQHQQEPFAFSDNVMRGVQTPLPPDTSSKASMQRRRPTKSSKENGDPQLDCSVRTSCIGNGKLPVKTSSTLARTRSDTPTPAFVFGTTPRSMMSTSQNLSRPMMTSDRVASATTTAATKLLQSSGLARKRAGADDTTANSTTISSDVSDTGSAVNTSMDDWSSSDSSSEACTVSSLGGICDSPPIPVQSCKVRPISDFRSSMPEADLLPTMSARLLAEGCTGDVNASADLCRVSASPCYRSLNSALQICQQSFSPTKSVSRSSVFSKSHVSSAKVTANCLPPNPSNAKLGMDAARKTKAASTQQEDIHMLRLLYNRYLQWRFANAKAEASMEAQRTAAERSLYSLVERVSELRGSVIAKHVELQHLKKTETISSILNGQIPYLDDWASLEGDYSSSLSGAAKALQDASLRIPVVGNVRADIRQVGEALNSASTVLESISPYVESSLSKAEEVESVISELAEAVSKERALIEECGDLLSKAHMLQVEECSLRGHLIQLKWDGFTQPREA